MQNFQYYTPTEVIFGKETEAKTGEMLKKYGAKKVLIHYGGGSVIRSGLLDRVKKSIDEQGISYVELGGAVPNPHLSLVYEGIELCRKEGVDFVLGVGGGSAIDSAKAIAYGVPYDGDVWDFYDKKANVEKALPIGVVLTMAATGSEMSNSSVITNENGWLKRGSSTDLGRPKFAIMNPVLTYTLPRYQTLCGCTDIMMHTMERYFSHETDTLLVDTIAEGLLRTMMDATRVVMEDPENYNARSEIMWAGSLSHNGLTGSGRAGDWSTHQIEHELGGKFDIAHGAGLAAVWASWARYVYMDDPARFAKFAVNVMGITPSEDVAATAAAGIDAMEAFFKSIEMPIRISECGIDLTEEQIQDMAYKCTYMGRRTIGGFKILGAEDIAAIYRMAK